MYYIKMDFYKHLNYSLGNEDWHVEEQALRIHSGDRVICVTASGDRPLHLLMTDCSEIHSVDMNPVQTYLLDLKFSALKQLDFEKYSAFLGSIKTPHRLTIFNEIKPYLTKESACFWEANKKMIKRGILYQGKVERLTHMAALIFSLFCNKKITKLFSFLEIEKQREYVYEHWDTHSLKKVFQILLNPRIAKFFINDPGLNTYVDESILPGHYIYDRMIQYLSNHLANKSLLLQLVLIGKVQEEVHFPYLSYAGYCKIRKNPNRLTFYTDDIIKFLHRHKGEGFDAYSLSDIASYMPQSAFEQLLNGIYHSANPNARFCLREFMSRRYIPAPLNSAFLRDRYLEKKLESEETNFIYRFFAGEIKKQM